LLGFGMMMDIEVLKWESQKPISKHMLAMSMIFNRQTELLTTILRWCHESLLGPGMEELFPLLKKKAKLPIYCLEVCPVG